MITRQLQRRLFKIYTESDHSYIQIPSSQVLAVCAHLRSHGIHARCPMAVTMDVHSLELPENTDLKAIQLLVDHYAAAQAALTSPAETARNDRVGSRTTLFG